MTPQRICIDKNTYVGRKPNGRTEGWVITGGSGSDINADRNASYRLEVTHHDFSSDPSRIARVAYVAGTRYEIETDEEFKLHAEAFSEHEIKVPEGMTHAEAQVKAYGEDTEPGSVDYLFYTQDEAEGELMDLGYWPERAARVIGINVKFFDELEAGWRAATQLFDFAITND